MKKIYLFCTKLRMFLCELPPLFLLVLCIINNPIAPGLLKLWPLIIALCGFMVFIIIFFTRFISISDEEVRIHGMFSSKDRSDLCKDRSLIITLKPKKKLYIEVNGSGEKPAFDWMKDTEIVRSEYNLFRERAVGARRSAEKILRYFFVPREDIEKIFDCESFEKCYDNISVKSELSEKNKIIRIDFLKTV